MIATKLFRRHLVEADSGLLVQMSEPGDQFARDRASDDAAELRAVNQQLLAARLDAQKQTEANIGLHAAVRDGAQLLALSADIGLALARGETLRDSLQHCAAALVRHLDAAFARIWTLNESEQVLELQASAGLYTHLDGPHGRVRVGELKIGSIALGRTPHLTNEVIGDPSVSDQDWAKRERMVAFAGYPLIVEKRVVGVMALFARRPLSDSTLRAMASVSNVVAVGIERKRGEEERAHLLIAERSARDQAEAALRARDEFIAIASHELRTPLAALKTNAQMALRRLDRGALDEGRAKRHLEGICEAADRLDRLVTDLMDVSRMPRGELLIHTEPMDLMLLVNTVTRRYAESAVDRHCVIGQLADGSFVVDGDSGRLEQVLDNLLGNAVKYTPLGGEIRVALAALAGQIPHERDGVVLSVSDTGIGLPPGEREAIFEPFGRGTNAARQGAPGIGLGLYICRRIVEAHGGRMWAESAGEGQGMTLNVWLPVDTMSVLADPGSAGHEH